MKKSFWRIFPKKKRKRKSKPKSGLVVSNGPEQPKTKPDRWIPPFATKKAKSNNQDLLVVTEPNGFDLGKTTVTVGVMLQMSLDYNFQLFVEDCLDRFKNLDWGGINEKERLINEHRITAQTGTVFGIYTELTSGVQIWIVTDLDQGITRICLSDER